MTRFFNAMIKSFVWLLLVVLPFFSASQASVLTQSSSLEQAYVRCWHRLGHSTNGAQSRWVWATNNDGSYYTIAGRWHAFSSGASLFYTEVSQQALLARCRSTIGGTVDHSDMLFYAADNFLSLNYMIWTQDDSTSFDEEGINKIVAFGDSLSDTGNLFNASSWLLPNRHSWYVGHFTNGLLWTEYIARSLQLPLYTWAVGGSGGQDHLFIAKGVTSQIESFKHYSQKAQGYSPETTLFTLGFGANDFLIFHLTMDQILSGVDAVFESFLLLNPKHILLMLLPDISILPLYSDKTLTEKKALSDKIYRVNQYIKMQCERLKQQGREVACFDTFSFVNHLINEPKTYDLVNTQAPCLDINVRNLAVFGYPQTVSDQCFALGADRYLFWDAIHPTTRVHKIIADYLGETLLTTFSFVGAFQVNIDHKNASMQ
ncbi:MAG: SGNH/GDSL hydrolase family protein [Cellvibrionales bacterium]|nr:SGNH/GDSL hydrolase family protein [Cellvibrionales bacterium]